MLLLEDPTKTFPKRVWYEKAEIEKIAETCLKNADWPKIDKGPAIDIDRVVERLGFDLDIRDLPESVLGTTIFTNTGKAIICVSPALYEGLENSPGRRARLRSTLAHELAHALLHAEVFKEAQKGAMCRSEASGGEEKAYKGEWWEYQANLGMSAILMPEKLFTAYALKVKVDGQWVDPLVRTLADRFEVGLAATAYRLMGMNILSPDEVRDLSELGYA
ncbi:MAG: ImmA/IrrE family metallo-endopeptidase [Elusimicrobia bacterium]|nr:ImmA/IrrE family metallo-endopeptidase [Elusimicrobiota bacterium]